MIFPGFSWSNWNGGAQNQIPRNKGNFLWRQAYNLRLLNIKTAEIAMMDEYDEGTAILPIADGFNMIPTNQYFVTTSADGSYLSSDFYIRLAYNVTRQINQLDAVNSTMPIQYSNGPIFFRTSNEAKYDAQPTWVGTTEQKSNVSANGSNFGNPSCATISQNPHIGVYSLKVSGRDRSASSSYAYFKVWDVNIPISSNTQLSFWTYPQNVLGRYVSVDLVMTDGTTLRASRAVDSNGISMNPNTGRGTINTWTKATCNIGTWFNGKTIDRILVDYDHAPATGDFSSYLDDISISTASSQQFANSLPANNISNSGNEAGSQQIYIMSNPFTNGIMIRLANQPKDKVLLHLYDASGKLLVSQEFKNIGNHIQLNIPFLISKGVYMLETIADGVLFTNRLVKE